MERVVSVIKTYFNNKAIRKRCLYGFKVPLAGKFMFRYIPPNGKLCRNPTSDLL